jgi:RHS repeat-associated protein
VLGRDALDRIFGYDALYRLALATGREVDRPAEQSPDAPFDPRPRGTDLTKTRAYRERYRYDALGNLEELNHATFNGRPNTNAFIRRFQHLPGTNQLATMTIGQTTFDYAYDKNGNLKDESTSRHFEWDHSDRMKVFRNQVQAADGDNNKNLAEPTIYAHYLYDSTGMRVKKLVRKQGGITETTEYIDGVFEFQRASGVENNTLHVMDGEKRVATKRIGPSFPDDATPPIKYHLGDHLSSINVVVSKDGKFINREEYTPYGETSFGSFARKRYRFTGKEQDEENGLYYYGARYCAPWLGRWVSCDPAGATDSVNLYLYATANPATNIDRYGLQAEGATNIHVEPDVDMSESELDKDYPSWREGAIHVHGAIPPLDLAPFEFDVWDAQRDNRLSQAERYGLWDRHPEYMTAVHETSKLARRITAAGWTTAHLAQLKGFMHGAVAVGSIYMSLAIGWLGAPAMTGDLIAVGVEGTAAGVGTSGGSIGVAKLVSQSRPAPAPIVGRAQKTSPGHGRAIHSREGSGG